MVLVLTYCLLPKARSLWGKKVFAAIGEIKRVLDENPSAKILIEGHASSDGSA